MIERLRARIADYRQAWGWHPEGALDKNGDALRAGYGHHMGQMLYRLPRDGQTDDMRRSIHSMLEDLATLLDAAAEANRLREGIEAVVATPDDTQWWPVRPYMDPHDEDEVTEVQVIAADRLRALLSGAADRG